MIARCDSCGREYLEIDCRRVESPQCVICIVDEIEDSAQDDIADCAQALRAIAAVPAGWVGRRIARAMMRAGGAR